jgi:hypothetical protein
MAGYSGSRNGLSIQFGQNAHQNVATFNGSFAQHRLGRFRCGECRFSGNWFTERI